MSHTTLYASHTAVEQYDYGRAGQREETQVSNSDVMRR